MIAMPTMPWYEYVGFLAVFTNIAGNWLLTSKHETGWYVRIACNVFQLSYTVFVWNALHVFQSHYALSAVVFSGINIVGMRRWKRARGHDDKCGGRVPCSCGRFA